MIKTIAFVGIGVMGYPMAEHLIDAGYSLRVFNRNSDKCKGLVKKGALLASSLADVMKDADIVFTMLPNEAIVHDVILGDDGLASAAKKDCIFANSSTVSPESNIKLGRKLAKLGMRFIDSPVTGSGLQARDKTLLFIVSGEEAAFNEALPLYKAMGVDAIYAGDTVGTASYAKVCSNAMMAMNMLSFCEAVVMAKKAGVDPQVFVKFCAGGGPRSAMADKKVGKIVKRDFSPAFRTALMSKDTGLAAQIARDLHIPTPALNLAKEMFQIACVEGYSDDDLCAIVKCYEKWAGVEVK
ncbi:2-hydroxy-3-oxopropionate reductase [Synergistales bacterium]|nr:2-hydroxy-3-oxopropionate reductase [Synergistales bacterium]